MRILLFNHLLSGYDLKDGAQVCHGTAGRTWGLAKGFGRLGWQSDILSIYPNARAGRSMTHWENVGLVHAKTFNPHDYDVILLMESASWDHLLKWSWEGKHPRTIELLDHPFACALIDGLSHVDEHIARRAKLVGHVSHRNIPIWRKRYGDDPPCFLSQWAAPTDLPFDQEDPYKRNPNLIYAGCMLPRYAERLNELAEKFNGDIWLIALFMAFCKTMPQLMVEPSEGVVAGYGLSGEGRRKLFPAENIRFVSDVRPAGYGHGPVVYGRFWDFLEHADVALGFTERRGMLNWHVKTFDYLAYGLPVVHEKGSPLDDMVFSEKGTDIKLVTWNDSNALSAAIEEALVENPTRELIREWIQKYHTWDNRAEAWIDRIERRKKNG